MARSEDPEDEVPIFLKWASADEEEEPHFFLRSDWVMEFLFDHLSREDALRTWTKMHAERIRAHDGETEAREFLEAFGVPEH
jgi:hypothetical protein